MPHNVRIWQRAIRGFLIMKPATRVLALLRSRPAFGLLSQERLASWLLDQ